MNWILQPLKLIDALLLSRVYTPFVRFAGSRFGLTNSDLVLWSMYLNIPVVLMSTYLGFKDWSNLTAGVGGVMMLVCLPIFFGATAHKVSKWPNTLYIQLFWFRVYLLALTLFQIIGVTIWRDLPGVLVLMNDVLLTSGMYIASLPPAPPKKVRIPKGLTHVA
jgi:hypothetical protein